MRVVYFLEELNEGAFIGVFGLGGLEYVRKMDVSLRFRNLNVALDHGRDVDSSLRNVAFYPLYEPE